MRDPVRLDGHDRSILFLLQENARTTPADIAELTGLALWDVARRIGRLEAEHLLIGAGVRIDPERAGLALEALFRVRLADDRRAGVDAFAEAVRLSDPILDAWRIDPPGSYLLRVQARDETDLERIRLDVIERLPGVIACAVTPVIERIKRDGKLPL